MQPRTATAWVWGVTAGIAALVAMGLLLPPVPDDDPTFPLLVGLPFAVVGALVAHRRPHNPVGWLFLAFGAVAAVAFATGRYWPPVGSASRPAAALVASLGVHLWHPGFALFIIGFLLFPNGRALSRRWAVAVWVTAALGVVGVVSGMLEHAFYEDFIVGDVLPAPLLTGPVADVAGVIFSICVLGLVLAMLPLSGAGIVLRFLRATGVERQQMSWVVLAVIVFAVALPTSLLLVDNATGVYTLPLIPIAAGIAILRHQLFDIDVIVNRALVYGTSTAVLAAVYVVVTVAVGTAARGITQEDSSFAVAVSTLAVAALFRPLRDRVRRLIDRRFYRTRYNAQQTVAAFSTRLRHQVDLEATTAELLATVAATVQPDGVQVWLTRPSTTRLGSS